MTIPLTCITLLTVLCAARSARILGVFPTPSVSHQIVYQPIWKELSLKGHQVTVLTPSPLHDPQLTNLTEIDLSFTYGKDIDASQIIGRITHWDMLNFIIPAHDNLYGNILSYPDVESMLNNPNVYFDLVIAEFFQPTVSAFAHKYGCPLIGVTSMGVMATTHEAVGNPAHPILHPDFLLPLDQDMTFFEKIEAVMYTLRVRYDYYTINLPHFDKFARRFFGDDMPYLGDLERNISLLFLNTNRIIHGARPHVPGVVELGGMHIKPQKPLPEVRLHDVIN